MNEQATTAGYMVYGDGSGPAMKVAGQVFVRAVQLIDGWSGQILLGDRIIWQSDTEAVRAGGFGNGPRTRQDALNAAEARVQQKLTELFGA